MAIITAGYDGTVDEVQFAKLLHRYSVAGAGDFKATTIAGDRIVSIANGTALGPGTVDVATDIPPIQFEAATGTRWDMVVLRRDWQPPGGLSEIRIVKGGSSDTLPAVGTAATAWNRRPGIMDDQPLYLQEINGTLLGNRIDLRCWQSNGGLVANHDRVRSYLDTPGTRVHINGVDWVRRVGTNDTAEWVEADGGVQHAEFTGSTVPDIPTSAPTWGTGPLAFDAGASKNGGIYTSPANDRIAVPAGLHSISVRAQMSTASTGKTWMAITNDSNTVTYASWDVQKGDTTASPSLPNFYAAQPQNLRIVFFSDTAPGYSLSSRVRVSKIR